MTTDEIITLAESLGVSVVEHDEGPKGFYWHAGRRISLRRGLAGPSLRCTLAHELGHAVAGDEASGVDWADARRERAADQFAAELLITREAYAEAEEIVGPHPGALARELGVTIHMVDVWRSLYARA